MSLDSRKILRIKSEPAILASRSHTRSQHLIADNSPHFLLLAAMSIQIRLHVHDLFGVIPVGVVSGAVRVLRHGGVLHLQRRELAHHESRRGCADMVSWLDLSTHTHYYTPRVHGRGGRAAALLYRAPPSRAPRACGHCHPTHTGQASSITRGGCSVRVKMLKLWIRASRQAWRKPPYPQPRRNQCHHYRSDTTSSSSTAASSPRRFNGSDLSLFFDVMLCLRIFLHTNSVRWVWHK